MPIEELPPDQFNVVVENDMDRARLLWLVNRIGEAKLRRTVGKYLARWEGAKPFVSRILKVYNLTVPVAVYAPVRIPVYWLYVLYTTDGSEVKVGMTGDWPWRAFAFLSLHAKITDVFDPDRSCAFLVGGNKVEVLRREMAITKAFAPWRSRPKDGWNNGYTEWFQGDRLDDIMAMAASFDDKKDLVVQTLRTAILIQAEVANASAQ